MIETGDKQAKTAFNAFIAAAERWPAQPFLHIPASATTAYSSCAVDLSYSEAQQQILSLQAIYRDAGYGLGHRLALLLENRAESFLHWLALNGLGVSVVPINGEMSSGEIAYLLEHSESCLVVTIPEKEALLRDAASAAAIELHILAHTNLCALPAPALPATAGAPGEQSECAVLYTSGSTGKPKGCILNNEYFLYSGRWYRDLGGLCALEPGVERLLTPLPMVHMNAMACSTMGMIMTGGCIIQLDRFHPSSWWQTVRESGATALHYLGVMPAMLLNTEPAAEDDFSKQIKFAFGAGVNPKHHAAFEARFGFPLIEAWAMTESGVGGAIIANREPRHVGSSCFGKPSDALEYRLVDEAGQDVSPGEQGELLIRATGDNPWRGFFSGYLKNDIATDEALANGWLHTGDVIRVGEDGSMRFVDRRKNVIRRSGENISALEVEATLSECEAINSAVVTPVPDDIRGDEVFAAIVLNAGFDKSTETAGKLFDHCFEALTYYKAPGYIHFVSELPLTASGKPQRGEIKKMAAVWAEQNDVIDLRERKRKDPKTGARRA
jgi:acyl-coenzyme A synthetase/AMP-(fatty) acid ligase